MSFVLVFRFLSDKFPSQDVPALFSSLIAEESVPRGPPPELVDYRLYDRNR